VATRKQMVSAAEAHSNLNTFGAIIALLEGGLLYGGGSQQSTAEQIIKLCKREQQRQLSKFDKELTHGN
jgi:hypothetical protein